jgi:hypothetical protein
MEEHAGAELAGDVLKLIWTAETTEESGAVDTVVALGGARFTV